MFANLVNQQMSAKYLEQPNIMNGKKKCKFLVKKKQNQAQRLYNKPTDIFLI